MQHRHLGRSLGWQELHPAVLVTTPLDHAQKLKSTVEQFAFGRWRHRARGFG